MLVVVTPNPSRESADTEIRLRKTLYESGRFRYGLTV